MRTLVVNAFRMAQQRTGIGRYIEFVAQQWSRMKIPFDRVVLMSPKNIEIDRLIASLPLRSRCSGSDSSRHFGNRYVSTERQKVLRYCFAPPTSVPCCIVGAWCWQIMASMKPYQASFPGSPTSVRRRCNGTVRSVPNA